MYLDVKGLVSTGVGNLIDPIEAATSLPWLRSDMQPASQAEIKQAWNDVKARIDLALLGGGHYKDVTTLRLTEGAIDNMVMDRLRNNIRILSQRQPCFLTLPVDAQLAVLSMAWALGAAFDQKWPKFWEALSAGHYVEAADQCHISGAGTIVQRNLRNKLLLVNAARTKNPSVLSWPKVLLPPTT